MIRAFVLMLHIRQGFVPWLEVGWLDVVSVISAVPLRFFFRSERFLRLPLSAGISVSRMTAPELFCPLMSVSSDGV